MKKFLTHIILCVFFAISGRAETIMMVGDSHVAGKTYPRTVESLLTDHVKDCHFTFFGINGASFPTFCKPENLDTIFSIRPDILIVHLGTNDCYARKFNPDVFRQNMTRFYNAVHDSLPEVKMVFVTPFFNKHKHTIRSKNKKRRTVWELNNNNATCADEIVKFHEKHPEDTRVINHNAAHGMDFLNNGLINARDNVHLTVPGYVMLGTQVAEEFLTLPDLFSSQAEK
ncbi:MAG: hypothetical protein K2K82_09135 [Muribaculaceae bacterium]|nr:hypothetical protein [Muribaculaceae bacterium]